MIGCRKSLALFLLNFQLFIKLVTIMRFKSNILFDDEFPTRCQLHNAPLIEARFPIVKKLGEPIFTALSCGQLPTTKLVRHGQK